jgi:FkbM family methyltransferase
VTKIKIAILTLIALLAGVLILARVAPAVPLRAYFGMERKLDLDILRSLEPVFIKAGILRPARVRVRGGFTMVLDPRDLVPLILLRTGEWQPEVWDAVVAALPKDGIFLDVGAHIGIFTLKASRQVGPGGKAIAFEPNPETAALLRDNVSANHLGNVTVEEIACTDKDQQLTLYAAPINNTGASSLSKTNASYGDAPRPFQVRGRPIDDVVRELNLDRVDAIKIDVEGAELQVLKGAEETLKRFHPKIVLEVLPAQLASFHTTPQQVAAFIKSTGYTIGSPLTKDATDWQWTAVSQSMVKMNDLVAAPQLLSGFGGVEAATWRWTAKQFDIALRAPDGASSNGAILVGKFVFPGVAFQQLKQVRLSAKISGVELPPATFSSEGEHEYRAEIPARLLEDGNPAEIDFSLDKSLKDDLGLIAVSIGFEPAVTSPQSNASGPSHSPGRHIP